MDVVGELIGEAAAGVATISVVAWEEERGGDAEAERKRRLPLAHAHLLPKRRAVSVGCQSPLGCCRHATSIHASPLKAIEIAWKD